MSLPCLFLKFTVVEATDAQAKERFEATLASHKALSDTEDPWVGKGNGYVSQAFFSPIFAKLKTI